MEFENLFIDANILISILEEDSFAPKIIEILDKYENIWISPISYLFGYEKCRKNNLDLNFIHEILEDFEITNINIKVIQKAKSICKDSDFEDAMQVASCLELGIPHFLTNDHKLAKRYKSLVETISL